MKWDMVLPACLLKLRRVVHAGELDLASISVCTDDGIDRRGGIASRTGNGSEEVSADIENKKQDRFTTGAWSLLQDYPVESHQLTFLGGLPSMSLQSAFAVLDPKHLPIHTSTAIRISRSVRHQVLDGKRLGI